MHSSYVNELDDKSLKDNERLEYLGDAVLDLAVGHQLMERFPDLREGDLTRIRAALVNERQLARIACELDMGAYLSLGKGELHTHGREKPSILAGAMEAVIAAIYLDGGFDAAFDFVAEKFSNRIKKAASGSGIRDHKTLLQERAQDMLGKTPRYRVISESGPAHDKVFKVCAKVADYETFGEGKSKKRAAQQAAKKLLEQMDPEPPLQFP
jgi:ribonuclease III